MSTEIKYTPADEAADFFKKMFSPTLRAWGNGLPRNIREPKPSGLDKVNEVLDLIADALSSLGKRDKDRVRAYLEGLRETLTTARTAYASVGAEDECDGPAAIAMIERIESVRTELRHAQFALDHAPADRAVITERRIDLDLSQAKAGELNRDLAALLRAVGFPALPAVASFTKAKVDALSVQRQLKNSPARALKAALDLVDRPALERKLGFCWRSDHEVWTWHDRLVLESTEAPATATAAE